MNTVSLVNCSVERWDDCKCWSAKDISECSSDLL
jgi:hypothetical protein